MITLLNRSKGKPLDSPAKWTHDWNATDSWSICDRQLTDMPPTVDRYATDSWPTYHRQLTDIPPTYDRYSVRRRNIDRYSADGLSLCRPNGGRHSTDCDHLSIDSRSTLDREAVDCRATVDRLSIDCRSTIDRYIDRVSTDIAIDIAVDITCSKHDPNNYYQFYENQTTSFLQIIIDFYLKTAQS